MLFIFDMGGVVTNTFEVNCLFDRLHLNSEDFFKVCRDFKFDLWEQFQTGMISVRDFWKEFNVRVKELQEAEAAAKQKNSFSWENKAFKGVQFTKDVDFSNVPEVKQDLFRLYFHPELNMETVEIIKELRKNHRVVCGTNTCESHWENHMERGDYAFFNQTYASNKIGVAKPSVEFFKTILEAENVSASEAFFVDDRLENCRAAEKAGIHAVQFSSAGELVEKINAQCNELRIKNEE